MFRFRFSSPIVIVSFPSLVGVRWADEELAVKVAALDSIFTRGGRAVEDVHDRVMLCG